MKKIFALLLALAMVCGMLAACDPIEPQGGEITPLPSTEATEPAETEPAETEPAPTEATNEKEVSLGTMNGGVYTNTYAGFSCTLDENWTFYTSEQLQELPANVSELLQDTELDTDLLGTQIFDMQAENVNEMVTMNVVYQKLDMATRLTYLAMTEEQILDAVLSEKDLMISSYAQAGIEVETIEKVTVEFCGETRFALLTTAATQGVPYFTLQLFDFHSGAYSVTTTFSSFVENNTADLLAMCSPA